MKNFCKKQHQHRQWWTVFVNVWSLIFFTPFAGTTKGWTFVFLPWGCPQGGNHLPLVAACSLSCADACCISCSCCCCSCSTSLTSAPDSESVSATRITVMASLSGFSVLVAIPSTYKSDLLRLLSVTVPSNRHVSWKYGLLLWSQQNRSKATMWLLHNITAMQGCTSRF